VDQRFTTPFIDVGALNGKILEFVGDGVVAGVFDGADGADGAEVVNAFTGDSQPE